MFTVFKPQADGLMFYDSQVSPASAPAFTEDSPHPPPLDEDAEGGSGGSPHGGASCVRTTLTDSTVRETVSTRSVLSEVGVSVVWISTDWDIMWSLTLSRVMSPLASDTPVSLWVSLFNPSSPIDLNNDE